VTASKPKEPPLPAFDVGLEIAVYGAPRYRDIVRALWAVVGLPWISGCSFMFMQGPPDNHARLKYFDCVSSVAAPVADTTGAAAYGLFAAATASIDDEDSEPPSPVLFGTFAALHLASAIYGYVDASSCNSAKQELANRIHQREAANDQRIEALERQLKARRVGCSSDSECKEDRICVSGSCAISPSKAAAPAPPPNWIPPESPAEGPATAPPGAAPVPPAAISPGAAPPAPPPPSP
jgi:hypothetical protein